MTESSGEENKLRVYAIGARKVSKKRLMAVDLSEYQEAHAMTDLDMAQFLECDPAYMYRLALRPTPDMTRPETVQQMALATGANAARISEILAETLAPAARSAAKARR